MEKERQHNQNTERILVIDDGCHYLDMWEDCLRTEGIELIFVSSHDVINKKAQDISDIALIILDDVALDCQNPDFIKMLREDKTFKCLPIVLHVRTILNKQIAKEIEAGLLYHLMKPCAKDSLLNTIRSASKRTLDVKEIITDVKEDKRILCIEGKSEFTFSTVSEAKDLAYLIAHSFPDPVSAVYGLTELMLNAIEHGNLGITYAEKKQLMLSGHLYDEIQRRARLIENQHKYAYVSYEETDEYIQVHIKDQGKGFNWQQYLHLSPDRARDPNGRGIATAKLSFTSLEYQGNGNEVICRMKKGHYQPQNTLHPKRKTRKKKLV